MGRSLAGWAVVGSIVLAVAIFGDKKSAVPTKPPGAPVAPVSLELPPASLHRAAPVQSYVPPPQSRPEPSQSPPAAFPREVKLRPIVRNLYVTGKEVPLREQPNGKAKILDRLPNGMSVGELSRREGWVEVRHPISAVEGWISTRRLTANAPREVDDEKPSVSAPAPFDTTAIIAALIARSLATYPGNCACPYHTDRAGKSCGRRSAHSRGGGRAPLCYESDITPAMIANYKARGGR